MPRGGMQSGELAKRLAKVRVGVRAELELTRQIYNGVPAYVIRDPISFQSFKLSSHDYHIFVALTHSEELGQTFERLCQQKKIESHEEEAFYQFVVHLNQIGILTLPVTNGASLYERYRRRKMVKWSSRISKMFFLRVPLFHPDAFLDRTINWIRPLFSRAAFVIWMISMLTCLVLIIGHWQEFQDPLATMLTLSNLPLLWSLVIGLKLFHEFGHAYACKHFGGQVPEMGAFFIVATPCAYVDASASWGFEKPRHRILVALAGMYFESIAAIFAVAVWALTSEGWVHSAAIYTVILSTVVTIGFNANPLMKYDGYYVLGDLLGMPNLRGDARKQLANDVKRLFFGLRLPPVTELVYRRAFLSLFGGLSAIYKLFVVFGICLIIAFKIPALGLGLAFVYLSTTILQWVGGLYNYLTKSEELESQRFRAWSVAAAFAAAIFAAILWLPIEKPTPVQGVVRGSADRVIRAETEGFLIRQPVENGQPMETGDIIFELDNPELRADLNRTVTTVRKLQNQLGHELERQNRDAFSTRLKAVKASFQQEYLTRRTKHLRIESPAAGVFSPPSREPKIGDFIQKGEVLGTICAGNKQVVTLMNEATIAGCKPRLGDIVYLTATGEPRAIKGIICRVAPTGSRVVDHAALTSVANGPISVDPKTMESSKPLYQVEIEIDSSSNIGHGDIVVARFAGEKTTVGRFLYRRGLSLFNTLRLATQ